MDAVGDVTLKIPKTKAPSPPPTADSGNPSMSRSRRAIDHPGSPGANPGMVTEDHTPPSPSVLTTTVT